MENVPALAVAVPLLSAAFVMAAAPVLSRRAADLIAILTALAALAICMIILMRLGRYEIYWFGGWLPVDGAAPGICFAIDRIGAVLAGIVAALTVAALVFSWHYFDTVGRLFHTLMLVFLGSMIGFCLSGDLFTLFVFFELMSVTAYGLTGYKIEKISLEGALNFAVTNSIGAFFILMGIGLLYGKTGALNLAQLGRSVFELGSTELVISSFILITAGFLVKGAIVPFHLWLPDAHAVAPTPVSVLFSGIMVELGLYGAARVYWAVFDGALGGHLSALRVLFLTGAAATMVIAGLMCFMQRHIKRLLAFSSISHMGVMLAGFALFTPEGLAGTLIYLAAHGFIKGGLFIGSGILLHTRLSVDEMELCGKGARLRVTGIVFLIGGLALAGLPASGLFWGKSVLEHAAAEAGLAWLSFLFLFSSVLTGGAVLRVTGRVFYGWGKDQKEIEDGAPSKREKPETMGTHRRSPWVLISPAAALIILSFLIGGVPDLNGRALRAALDFQDSAAYTEAVLGRTDGTEAPEHPAVPATSGKGVVLGFAAVLGAAALAMTALFKTRFPDPLRRAMDAFGAPLSRLFLVRSGEVGDYVAWLVFGTSVMGVLFFML